MTDSWSDSPGIVSLAGGIVVFIATMVGLLLVYPWSTYSASAFPWWTTASSYVVLAGLMAAVGTMAIRIGLRRRDVGEAPAAVLASITTALLCGVGALSFGPLGLDIPQTRVRGIFFAEWKFLTFFFYVALPVAVLTGIISTLGLRRRRTIG